MSILQDLEKARHSVGEEESSWIERFLEYHPHYFLDDVYYNQRVYAEYEKWRDSMKKKKNQFQKEMR